MYFISHNLLYSAYADDIKQWEMGLSGTIKKSKKCFDSKKVFIPQKCPTFLEFLNISRTNS